MIRGSDPLCLIDLRGTDLTIHIFGRIVVSAQTDPVVFFDDRDRMDLFLSIRVLIQLQDAHLLFIFDHIEWRHIVTGQQHRLAILNVRKDLHFFIFFRQIHF